MSASFDYIVVGAGSAGSALAARLSEDPDISVLLLEAGRPDRHPFIKMPIAWLMIAGNPNYTWNHESEPEPGLGGRSLRVPRGKTLGGSSSTNGMLYVRGHPRDYDLWRQQGCEGWSWQDVLPYFRRLETSWRGETPFHGGNGPVGVSVADGPEMMHEPLEAAAVQAGHALAHDHAGETPEGVGRAELTTSGGERSSAARAYLKPAMSRPNLTIRTGVLVRRVLIENGRATGVECSLDGSDVVYRCGREIVLCGGAYNSPQLLMLSGIGPAAHLATLGIAPIVDLKGVGENLSEHPLVQVAWRARSGDTFLKHLRMDRAALAAARWALFRSGAFVNNGAGTNIFLRTRPELDRPDIQLTCSAIGVNAKLWWPMARPAPVHRFSAGVCLLHQESRGRVWLRSADPADRPHILFNLLSRQADVDTMVRGIKAAREIYACEPQRSLVAEELWPGGKYVTDDELAAWVRRKCVVTQHPTGTCKMGVDEMAVVDPQLKVRGVDGLRVADASIMPEIPGGNTNVPSIMIGEKAADLLRGRTASQPRAAA